MIDDADRAAADEERAMDIFQRERQKLYKAPETAFPAIALNCVDCGEIIPEARLKAMPRAVRCANCAADVERKWNS